MLQVRSYLCKMLASLGRLVVQLVLSSFVEELHISFIHFGDDAVKAMDIEQGLRGCQERK